MRDDAPAQIHLHGTTFSVVLYAPVAHLAAFQSLLEVAVCAFASVRDQTPTSRDLESLQLTSNELGVQVSLLHARVGEDLLTSVLYSWLWSCLRSERKYTEIYRSESQAHRARCRQGWPKSVLIELAKTLRARKEDVRALKDVATFAVEVLRILKSSTPPPSYSDTIAQEHIAPPTYTRWCLADIKVATCETSASPSDTSPTTPSGLKRLSSSTRGPFESSLLHKRLLRPRFSTSFTSSDEGAHDAEMRGSSQRQETRNLLQSHLHGSLVRGVDCNITSSSTSTPSASSSTVSSPTTPSFPPPSPTAALGTSSTHIGSGGNTGKTDAQLAFEHWLDAPRCPRDVPQWHFQPAEGEADWLTEMLV